ncbi:MAG: hypothetical protein LAO31_06015 [Acidobacteriia bacterium]|nr:hypothetical protein [Terriglobia bacterium]
MPIRYPSISFHDRERARLNWSHIERSAPREILSPLVSLLKGSADPDTALNFFERFISNTPEKIVNYLARFPAALNVLIPLFSQSHFLSETLLMYPEYVEWLHRDKRIEFVKSKEDLLEELSRFESTLGGVELAERLARFKRKEYLRIALRDVTKIATLAETTWELSTLADVVLEKALRGCDQSLRNRYGAPRFLDEAGRIAPSEFVVLALGKLGGNELNYSSDIDLMYLYSHDGETEGIEGRAETRISNQEYFIKLSSAINEAVSRVTPAGWAFRVDLRLRPQGREGFLTRSAKSAIEYYDRHAQPWELQALLKARPVAGCLAVGKQLLNNLQVRIYPPEAKECIIESIEQMRIKLDDKLQQSEVPGFNVKLARGTIRDIEFITQCLQRIHGAHDAWVREGNTVLALRRLHDNNYLPRSEFFALASAYEFFRIIEHRLQLDRGQQTHTLSNQLSDHQVLALRMGFEDTRETPAREALLHAIEYHRGNVLRISGQIMNEGRVQVIARPGEGQALEEMGRGPGSQESHEMTAGLARLERIHPAFASALREIDFEGAARPGFHSFLEALISQAHLLRDFQLDAPSCQRLEALFGSGTTLSEAMVRNPGWALSLLEKSTSASRPAISRGQRNKSRLEGAPRIGSGKRKSNQASSAATGGLSSFRYEIRRQIFDTLAEDVLRQPPVGRSLQRLTETAEKAVAGALTLAIGQLSARSPVATRKILKNPDFHFGIFGLGRLASNELDVGSDLDLFFACDYASFKSRESVREVAFRLAETVVSILTSYTREGPLYRIDLRLRPSGKEGELVQDATYLIEYFRGIAKSWEHAAYLKLRPLAGDLSWAKTVSRKLTNASFSGVRPQVLREDLLDIRTRLEEAAHSLEGSFDLKQGRGGVYDIEFALAYSHFKNGMRYRAGSTLREAVGTARHRGILSDSTAAVFEEAILLYRVLDHSIRLIQGKSSPTVDQKIIQEIPLHLQGRIMSTLTSSSSVSRFVSGNPADEVMAACNRTAILVRRGMEQTFEGTP